MKLTIKNIRSIKHEAFFLTEGNILNIIRSNKTGKSTVCMCLLALMSGDPNPAGYDQRKLKDYVRKSDETDFEAYARLEDDGWTNEWRPETGSIFIHEDFPYRLPDVESLVYKDFTGNQNERRMMWSKALGLTMPSQHDVTHAVHELIEEHAFFSHHLLHWSPETDDLLTNDISHLNMIGAKKDETHDHVTARWDAMLKDFKGRVTDLKKHWETLTSKHSEERTNYGSKIADAWMPEGLTGDVVLDYQPRIAELEVEFNDLYQRAWSIRNEAEANISTINKLKTSIEKKRQSIDTSKQDIDRLKKEIEETPTEIANGAPERQIEINKLRKQHLALTADMTKQRQSVSELEDKLQKVADKRRIKVDKSKTNQRRIKDYTHDIDELEGSMKSDICPTCGQKTDMFKDDNKRREQTIRNMQMKREVLKEETRKLMIDIQSFDAESDKELIENQLEQERDSLLEYENKATDLRSQIKMLEVAHAEAISATTPMDDMKKRVSHLEGFIESEESSLSEYVFHLHERENSADNYDLRLAESDKLQEQAREIKRNIDRVKVHLEAFAIHGAIQSYQLLMSRILIGMRKLFNEDRVVVFNGDLEAISQQVGLGIVHYDSDLNQLLLDDRPLYQLSASERWLTQTIARMVIASTSGSKLLLVDGIDILENSTYRTEFKAACSQFVSSHNMFGIITETGHDEVDIGTLISTDVSE